MVAFCRRSASTRRVAPVCIHMSNTQASRRVAGGILRRTSCISLVCPGNAFFCHSTFGHNTWPCLWLQTAPRIVRIFLEHRLGTHCCNISAVFHVNVSFQTQSACRMSRIHFDVSLRLAFAHLTMTAARACSDVRALALPLPALPPSRPSSTAAWFFTFMVGLYASGCVMSTL